MLICSLTCANHIYFTEREKYMTDAHFNTVPAHSAKFHLENEKKTTHYSMHKCNIDSMQRTIYTFIEILNFLIFNGFLIAQFSFFPLHFTV